jgi:hypothetical protein
VRIKREALQDRRREVMTVSKNVKVKGSQPVVPHSITYCNIIVEDLHHNVIVRT